MGRQTPRPHPIHKLGGTENQCRYPQRPGYAHVRTQVDEVLDPILLIGGAQDNRRIQNARWISEEGRGNGHGEYTWHGEEERKGDLGWEYVH